MCTYPWPLAEELAIWEELGIRQVGVGMAKLDAHGRDRAVSALQEQALTVTTITARNFDLSAPETWPSTRAQ